MIPAMTNAADHGPDDAPPDAPGTLELETPILLLAMPQVQDPFFHKSVILLVHHHDAGSLGFIVNRPTGISINEILQGLDIDWNGTAEAMAFFGGPVRPQLGTLMYARGEEEEEEEEPARPLDGALGIEGFLDGLTLTQQITDLRNLAAAPPDPLRLFLGYAGWGEGQLEQEILRHDWLTAPVRQDLVFGSEPSTVWDAALASVGIDPNALPSWTGDNSGAAN